MDVLLFKIIAFIVIALTGLAGGGLAGKFGEAPNRQKVFSLGNAFAGGIFFGAGLLHMLPDASDNLGKVLTASDFPWVTLICALGFLLILFLEKVFTRGHEDLVLSGKEHRHGKLSPYILTLVLSIHSIIAGIALGAEDVIGKSLVIFIAVIAHKGSAAFALAVNLIREGVGRSGVNKVVGLFSAMTPLGMIIGALFSFLLGGRGEVFFEGVFDALAAGTFLYVALIDVIEEEFVSMTDNAVKFLAVAFGLGMMAILALFV